MMPKKVVVGMSGGVDSTAAALLLKAQGFEVIGLFMHNWEESDELGFCTAESDYEDVKLVCAKIGIPYYTVNFAKEYYARVFEYFLFELKRGRTPNPDVLCNREIKFGSFMQFALSLGADFVATGHYAGLTKTDDGFCLLKAADESKDQSYFLNQLNQRQLSRAMFPLQDYQKKDVRELVKSHGLATHAKKDSTGICFIGERNFKKFLSTYLPAQKGKILDTEGNVVGEHEGLMYYTLGQRRGLGLGGRAGGNGDRWFVLQKNLDKNELIVSQGEEDLLFSKALSVCKMHWISGAPPQADFRCTAKFRYRQPDQSVRVVVQGEGIEIYFDEKQRAITEGQFAVLYQNRICLGGGIIESKSGLDE